MSKAAPRHGIAGEDGRGALLSVVETVHGIQVADPYRWLEDPDSPATRQWLAERDREFAAAASRWRLRAPLARRIRELVATDLWTPPVRRGGLVFATRRPAGADHPAIVAIGPDPHNPGGPPRERTVFDPHAFDPSGGTTLDSWEPSPDGRRVAVQTSSGGTERGVLRVLDTDTGLPVEEAIQGVRYSHVAWVSPEAFYFVRRDGADGRRGVWLHRVSTGRAEPDVLVRPCSGPRTVPGVRLLGGRWLVVSESHGTGHRTDLWIADLGEAAARGADRAPAGVDRDGGPARPRWRPVHVGVDAESHPDLGPDGVLYLRTTLGASRRRVCAVDPADPGTDHWREVVPEDPEATLDGFAAAGTPEAPELLVTRTRLGISELAAHDPRDGRLLRVLPLPGEGMVTRLEAEPDGGAHLCYADVATQQCVLTLAPGADRPRPWPRGAEPARPADIRRRTTWCRSADGTPVPVTVFAAAGVADPATAAAPADTATASGAPTAATTAAEAAAAALPDPSGAAFSHAPAASGSAPTPASASAPPCAGDPPFAPGPTILHAYGGFGRPRQFGFSATVLAWLLAGGRYAVAHVRGGGDRGREWHLRGSGRAKVRAVEDLIAAADELAAAGWCARDQLCLSGGSAGGLLVLAAAALRPDLCSAVIASAPLTDMARFERLGLGSMWTREFGTAADPGDFAALMSYSPYHRVLAEGTARHPAVLLTGFHGDTRTDAAHPRKMCAALQSRGGRRPVLLRYERDVGHGPRAVTRAIALAADAHAFAADQTGLAGPAGGRGGVPAARSREAT
ncbi:prolyl oligopeptidase family serine peptidase [Streptomonospora sp. S1-112]|uniref:prolyl oligopeptidase n=1 Tax=Streptomonospora mangrovi TaxID=2883123 RepID=A0A9X3NMZ5_9ACTN|nr:prolyl oligopeptidase family serine peptidase [Streptomonospora mangrovi]MDA0566722.1 prolyl oligopeptidase family serine peptidase [Streptomonospora mangrovi]